MKAFNKGAAAALLCEAMEKWCAIKTLISRHPSTLASTRSQAKLTKLANLAILAVPLLENEDLAFAGRLVPLLYDSMILILNEAIGALGMQ